MAADKMVDYDAVVVRNSEPVSEYPREYDQFRMVALVHGIPIYNELTGKADMLGKNYIPELYRSGHHIIPTVHSVDQLDELMPSADTYVVKPLTGAGSIGLMLTTRDEILTWRFHSERLETPSRT